MKKSSYQVEPEMKYWVLETVLAVALLAIGWGWKYGEEFDWWVRFSPFVKRLAEGLLFLSAGVAFLWGRSKRRALFPAGSWDLRLFLFDIAFVIAGVVCMFEAFRLR